MPFLRFSRDKRGYENTYLCETIHRRGKPARTKILYWYRTPPGIKVGRPPFDDEVRRTVEAQNPNVRFDWPTIVATPMPPPEPEPWWEKRRAERQARQARRADDREAESEAASALTASPVTPDEAIAADSDVGGLSDGGETEDDGRLGANTEVATVAPTESGERAVPSQVTTQGAASGRRRRRGGRRRRGRHGQHGGDSSEGRAESPTAAAAEQKSESPAESAEIPSSSSED